MTETTSLLTGLRQDQRTRWQCGDMVLVETYLEQYASLRNDPAGVLELIANEVVLRQERGENPQLTDYLDRFSPFAMHLRLLFQAPRTNIVSISAMEQGKTVDLLAATTSADFPLLPGYEIIAELGRGGMGIVYQARQCSLKRLVALKMILGGRQASALAQTRFRTEAEAVARLRHPNIVQIYEIGEHNDRPFLALEYVEGGTLQQQVAGTPQPEREAARLVETLARAVHYTHQNGILHRDLKPNNILLTADGTPKITDFGVAKLMDADAGLTRTEVLIGTPNYMPPEQAAGNTKKIGVPADVYSLGAILYEMLTGRMPFQGDTLLNTLEQVRSKDPVSPRSVCGRISLDLETICLKCLNKEPGQRYPSAEALADDLHRFLAGKPIQARPVGPWQRLWRAARRRPAVVAGVLAVLALGCALLSTSSYLRTAAQLSQHRAEERYQQFVQRRNEAFFYGLLTPVEGALFIGAEATANLQAAELAARDALALAGIRVGSDDITVARHFPASRKAETAADCYALLQVLASVRGQQRAAEPGGKEHWQEALRILDRADQLGFHTRASALRRAQFLDQLGEKEEAKKYRDQARSAPPDGALDHFLIGEEQYRRGEWEEARNSFDRAVVLQPAHFWAQFFLAVCHLKSQDWKAARVGLNACLNQQPDFAWAYLFRSFANERLQALTEAETDFARALQLDLNQDARYVLFLTRGILRFNQKELEPAAADFRAAIALKPDQYNAYLNLAQVCLAQRQFEQADQLINEAMQLHPPVQVVFVYHLERGRNLLLDNKNQEALQASTDARNLGPQLPEPYEVRARALLALGRYEEAEEAFDQFLRKGGEAGSAVFRGRGLARMKRGKYPEAAEDYTRALAHAPDGEIYQHRGWAHFFADAWKLALRDFSKAIELAPQAGDAYVGHGLAAVMLGDYREAVRDAETALRLRPSAPEMMHNVACIYAQAVARSEANPAEKQKEALGTSYRRAAVAALRQAFLMVPPKDRHSFWTDKVLPDPALTPLRKDPEFKKLLGEHLRSPQSDGDR